MPGPDLMMQQVARNAARISQEQHRDSAPRGDNIQESNPDVGSSSAIPTKNVQEGISARFSAESLSALGMEKNQLSIAPEGGIDQAGIAGLINTEEGFLAQNPFDAADGSVMSVVNLNKEGTIPPANFAGDQSATGFTAPAGLSIKTDSQLMGSSKG